MKPQRKDNAKRTAARFIKSRALEGIARVGEPRQPTNAKEFFPVIIVEGNASLPSDTGDFVFVERVEAEAPVTVGEVHGVADAPQAEEEPPKTAAAAAVSAASLAAMAAKLPPRAISSADEIAARRAARRERIEREKAEGKRDRWGNLKKSAKRETRGDIILAMAGREGGATIDEIATACGWQRHTLRGYIGGTLRKRGHNIVAKREEGQPTRYLLNPQEDGVPA